MTFTSNQLRNHLCFDRPFTEVARIIGYGGVELPALWAATKELGLPRAKLLDAVYESTRADKREAPPPRYELRENMKRLCWQLLGPPPGHTLHEEMHQQGEGQEEPRTTPARRNGSSR